MSTDRQVQRVYAYDLDLKHAFYSGTEMERTRDFCLARLNLLYDEAEIEKWKNMDWSGKKKAHDIWSDCGGYNCRHHYSFVSKELVETLDLPVNIYHEIAN